jgi:hypothetical protein
VPEGRFLLGFQYMIDGHKDAAQGQFLKALKRQVAGTVGQAFLPANRQTGMSAPPVN